MKEKFSIHSNLWRRSQLLTFFCILKIGATFMSRFYPRGYKIERNWINACMNIYYYYYYYVILSSSQATQQIVYETPLFMGQETKPYTKFVYETSCLWDKRPTSAQLFDY